LTLYVNELSNFYANWYAAQESKLFQVKQETLSVQR